MKKIYVLELEDDCYYVGVAADVEHRVNSHISGGGSAWTKLHKPLGRDKITILSEGVGIDNPYNLVTVDEKTVTYHLMREKGYDKVRGAGWTQTNLPSMPFKPKYFKYKK